MTMDAIAISRSALDVEWQRMEVIAANLANENSSTAAGDAPYQPLRLVSGPSADFSALLDQRSGPAGVHIIAIEPQMAPPRLVFEPGHPHADSEGFVRYPNIDRATEMALLIQSSRTYEASLAAISIAQRMYMRALELGRRQ